jgi:hypothetical protein
LAHRVYPVESHYLIEIDTCEDDKVTKTWIWDVYIASDGNKDYRGRAKESTGEYEISWTVLRDHDLLQEMIRHCQMVMFEI